MNNYAELSILIEEMYAKFPDYVKQANRRAIGHDSYHHDMDNPDYLKILCNRLVTNTLQPHDRIVMSFITGFHTRTNPVYGETFDDFIEILKENNCTTEEINIIIHDTYIPFSSIGESLVINKILDEYGVTATAMCEVIGFGKNYITRTSKKKYHISKPAFFALCMFFEFPENYIKDLAMSMEICLCEDYPPDKIFLMMIRKKLYKFGAYSEIVYKLGELAKESIKSDFNPYYKETMIFYSNYDSYTNYTYYDCLDEKGKFNKNNAGLYKREK